ASAEAAAEGGLDAESVEEAAGDESSGRILCAGGGLQHEARGRVEVEGREDGVLVLPVHIVLIGEVEAWTEGVAFEEDDEAGGIGVGERTDERGVDEAENRDGGTDAKGEDQDRCGGE